jgi:hypothetical protein
MSWSAKQKRIPHETEIRAHRDKRRNSGNHRVDQSQDSRATINGIPSPIRGAKADGLPRLRRMSGPSNKERETLGKRVRSRQFFAEIFGWLVGVGLVVEYWGELVDCVVNEHLPSQPLLGGILVTTGVFLEVLFSRIALIVSDELQQRADSDVAQANERAANAERMAAEANLARARIEEKFKPRRLDKSAVELLIEDLKEHKDLRIDVFVFDNHLTEVMLLGDSLTAALKTGGCNCKMWLLASGHRLHGKSISLAVARDATAEQQTFFSTLTVIIGSAFARSDIRYSFSWGAFSKTDPWIPNSIAGYVSPWDPADAAPYRIQIVERSFTDDPF